jgi:glycosyltransferase involved in cell wall biosynthesis
MRPELIGAHSRPELVVFSHARLSSGPAGWLTKNRVGEVVHRLAELGWEVTLVGREGSPASFVTYPLEGRVRVLPFTFPPRRLEGLRRWYRIARAAHRAHAALVFMPTVVNSLMALVLGRRAVVYAGNAWALLPDMPRWRMLLEALVARRAAQVIAHGDAAVERFEGLARTVAPCVPLVSPDVGARLRNGTAEEKSYSPLRLLFVGSLNPRKGVGELLDAIEALPDIQCRIVGPAADERLARRASDLAAGRENLTVDEYLEWPELREAYRGANLLVLPTYAEGFPRVAYEAAAFGLALLLSPVGGIPGRLRGGKDAVFVPPRDAVALTAALRELADDADRVAELAGNARRALAPYFQEPDPAAQLHRCLGAVVEHA